MKKFFHRKIVLAFFAVAIIFGAWTTWYVFFKPHRNFSTEKAAFVLTAEQLSQEFKTDTAKATAKFIDKAVLLEGTVTQIDGTTISFNNVACNMDSTAYSKMAAIKAGSKIKLQGQVVGYNELMEEIGLAQCVFK